MKKRTIIDMQKIAIKRQGECLSKKYINDDSKLLFKCNLDNCQWFARPHDILRNHWCPQCAGNKKYTIEDCEKLANSRDGKCLSKKYINSGTKLKWKCNKDNYKWDNTPGHIFHGQWCAKCSKRKKHTLQEVKDYCKNQQGSCLSLKYKNHKSKLKFKCKEGHIWSTSFNNILNGKQWCPECASGRSETVCKKYLENQTGFKFIKCNPIWLNKLQLDGFCKELNLAFEYNGIQHYKFNKYFHNSKEDFTNQQERDKLKRKILEQRKIKLIDIPFNFNYKNIKSLYEFINNQLNKFQIK
jgi:hypothetical protein